MSQTLDLVVLGGGPGGYVAAIRAAQLGLRTALVERERLGGVCLHWGCIPTKALLRNAELFRAAQRGEEFGWSSGSLRYDPARGVARSRKASATLMQGIEYLMKKHGIEVHTGSGRLTGKDRLEVLDEQGKPLHELRSRFVLLATGSRPRALPMLPFDGRRVLSSREAVVLEEIPGRLAVIGAGAIGLELGYYYRSFGSEVTYVETLDRVLPQEDPEVSALLARSIAKDGCQAWVSSQVREATVSGSEVILKIASQEGERELRADRVLVSIGVQGNHEDLNLEVAGLEPQGAFLEADGVGRTPVPNIFAIGDLVGPPLLAHAASARGIRAAEAMAGGNPEPLRADRVPRCVYCEPEVASVGLTEAEARQGGREVAVGKFPLRASGRALTAGDGEGFVKLVVDKAYGEVLGAQMVGAGVTELVAEVAVAIAHEATAESLHDVVHAHPTLSEAVMEAAGAAIGKAIHG
ncbi:MAG: dihydrolipoyl dehydrogenase [Acidobacteria bacterium]|nr:dihydrolipoyl dehydrogenase [Acidobacteriota bacterium]